MDIIMVHDVSGTLSLWVSGGSPGLGVIGIYLSLFLVTWPVPHPICVAVGTCQYFYLGMDH